MKQFLIGLLGGILILTACAPATVESTASPSPSETATITTASCSFISYKGRKQAQAQLTTPCNRNLATTHTVVPTLKWQWHSGSHTNPPTRCTMAAPRRSSMRWSTLKFSCHQEAIITAHKVISTCPRMCVRSDSYQQSAVNDQLKADS